MLITDGRLRGYYLTTSSLFGWVRVLIVRKSEHGENNYIWNTNNKDCIDQIITLHNCIKKVNLQIIQMYRSRIQETLLKLKLMNGIFLVHEMLYVFL